MEPVTANVGLDFPHVFSPLRIGPVEMANRIGVSAHFAGWWATEGLPNDAFRAYVEERARGGVGLFIIGDANQPRTVEEATFQGGRVGRLL